MPGPYLAGIAVEDVLADAYRQANLVNGILAAVAPGFGGPAVQLTGVAQTDGGFQGRGSRSFLLVSDFQSMSEP